MKTLLTCDNVSFSYENQIVVKDLTFSIKSGDYLCIAGENGSGKTTLMKGLLGLKKPAGGRIIMADGVRHDEIGYLPQQTEAQKDFPASVREIVQSGCLNSRGLRPGFSAKDRQRAKENMELLGIYPLRQKSYRELSGGQQQRVLLARALCATGKAILLDEPTTGLDPVVASEFYQLLGHLNQEKGITVIMISHAIQEAVSYAGTILHLSKDSYFYGTAQEYCFSETGKRFLGGKME